MTSDPPETYYERERSFLWLRARVQYMLSESYHLKVQQHTHTREHFLFQMAEGPRAAALRGPATT